MAENQQANPVSLIVYWHLGKSITFSDDLRLLVTSFYLSNAAVKNQKS